MSIGSVLRGEKRWHVELGDCLSVLSDVPDKSVAHVITDPPYSEHVHSKSRSGRNLPDVSDFACRSRRAVDFGFPHITQDEREDAADHFERIATRWTIVFCDVESSHLWSGALKIAGLEHVRTCAWIKLGCTPQMTGDRPAVGFEAIEVAHPKGKKRWNGGGSRGVWSYPIELDRYGHGNVARMHTTQKPLDLMLKLVELFTDPDDIVADPFCGFSTTGVACLRLDRRFIGVERDARYHKLSVERLTAESNSTTFQAARAGQTALFGGIK